MHRDFGVEVFGVGGIGDEGDCSCVCIPLSWRQAGRENVLPLEVGLDAVDRWCGHLACHPCVTDTRVGRCRQHRTAAAEMPLRAL